MTKIQRLFVAGVLTLATAAGCTSAQLPRASAVRAPAIAWGACPPLAEGAHRDPRQVCGTVTVPLDYERPDGRTITVAVSRISTAKPGHRRGYLLVNPGGPALEGLDMPGEMASTLSKPVVDAYDLIGFDPRGVGHSSPVSCHLSGVSFADAFPYPAADGSIHRNIDTGRTLARECASAGPDLRYFTTANTARDLDRVRQALGTAKISYWGQSYGTYLGAVYTSLFPAHTDRMVLEGNVDPDRVWAGEWKLWGKGMADRFPDAARVAARDNAELGLGRNVKQVEKTYLALADRLDRKPVQVPGTSVSINGVLLRGVTYELLLHNDTIEPLTHFWKATAGLAAGRSPSAADLTVLQQVLAGSPDEPGVPADNQVSMVLALVCGDVAWSKDLPRYQAAVTADRAKYPLTAGMPANVWPCAFWPNRPIGRPVPVTSHGPRDILVLQNRRDHATPWEGALGMRKALGARAGFVGADNGGHYVYKTGSACVDRATDAFLTKGVLPAADRYCRLG